MVVEYSGLGKADVEELVLTLKRLSRSDKVDADTAQRLEVASDVLKYFHVRHLDKYPLPLQYMSITQHG